MITAFFEALHMEKTPTKKVTMVVSAEVMYPSGSKRKVWSEEIAKEAHDFKGNSKTMKYLHWE